MNIRRLGWVLATLLLTPPASAAEPEPAPTTTSTAAATATTPAPATTAAAAAPEQAAGDDGGEEEEHRWHFEAAFFPTVTQQQVEGPNRDDLLTNDVGLSSTFTFGYAPIKWIEPSLWVQVDAGSVRRAVFTRPDDEGVATEAQLAEGSYWSLWLAFMLRSRIGPAFVELGWAPLILRDDSLRSDLVDINGKAEGLFEGSRAVAYILGGGASIPVWDNFDITARLQFRIRYLVTRGGQKLADDEETGQMTVWPFIGGHYHF